MMSECTVTTLTDDDNDEGEEFAEVLKVRDLDQSNEDSSHPFPHLINSRQRRVLEEQFFWNSCHPYTGERDYSRFWTVLLIFSHLKLWVAVARHNVKWLKIKNN